MTCNIFYTDDDPEDLETFNDAINDISPDVRVTNFINGTDLLHNLRNPPPIANIIFLDLNLPIRNGFEILKELKKIDIAHHLPVIVFSTSDAIDYVEISKKLGACLYIKKPSSYKTLKHILQTVLLIDWNTFQPSDKNFFYSGDDVFNFS